MALTFLGVISPYHQGTNSFCISVKFQGERIWWVQVNDWSLLGKILRKACSIIWPTDGLVWSDSHTWAIQLCSGEISGGGAVGLMLTQWQFIFKNHLWSGRGQDSLGSLGGFGPGKLAKVGPVFSFFLRTEAERVQYPRVCSLGNSDLLSLVYCRIPSLRTVPGTWQAFK